MNDVKDSNLLSLNDAPKVGVGIVCILCGENMTFFDRHCIKQPYVCGSCRDTFSTMKKFITALEEGGVL